MFKLFQNTVRIAHCCLGSHLKPGDVAVDATVGNGKDTLYLAGLVSPGGHVYGFDIQEKAIKAADKLISSHGYSEQVTLFQAGHEKMKDYIHEPVNAVVFNLGYLPGGDHDIVTKPETTVNAVQQGLQLLRPGGILCLVIYTGHPAGKLEQEALETFLCSLEKDQFCVGKLDFINRQRAPYLIIVEKRL